MMTIAELLDIASNLTRTTPPTPNEPEESKA